jgi:hypothetical protein
MYHQEDGIRLGPSGLISPDLDTSRWFTSDLGDVAAQKECWWKKLSGIANTLFTQAVLLHNGYQTSGGRTTLWSLDSNRQLLERVPTPAWEDGSYPIFPIANKSIGEWVHHLKSAYGVSSRATPAHAHGVHQLQYELDHDCDHAAEEPIPPMSHEQVTMAISQGEYDLERIQRGLIEALEQADIDLKDHAMADFARATHMGTVPIQEPRLPPWLTQMGMSNIFGQFEVMFHRGAAFQQGLALQNIYNETQSERIEQYKTRLLEQAKEVRKAVKALKVNNERNKRGLAEISALEREVQEGMQNPAIRTFVDRQARDNALAARYSAASRQSPVFNASPAFNAQPLYLPMLWSLTLVLRLLEVAPHRPPHCLRLTMAPAIACTRLCHLHDSSICLMMMMMTMTMLQALGVDCQLMKTKWALKLQVMSLEIVMVQGLARNWLEISPLAGV